MTRESQDDLGGARTELDRDAIHAVALISRCLEAFTLEHMAQMATAGCTCDLYPPTIRIWCSVYGSWKPLKECRPAAARIKFCGGLVQGSPAASAVINPVAVEFVVLSCPG